MDRFTGTCCHSKLERDSPRRHKPLLCSVELREPLDDTGALQMLSMAASIRQLKVLGLYTEAQAPLDVSFCLQLVR